MPKVAIFCVVCGYEFQPDAKFCTKCGHQRYEGEDVDDTIYCPDCGHEILLDNGMLYCHYCQHLVEKPIDNNRERESGLSSFQKAIQYQMTGSQSLAAFASIPVPREVQRWSWPAFWLMVPWLFTHGLTEWAVAMLVVIPLALIPFLGILLAIADWVAFFYLCIHGNELAWKRGQFRDLNHFSARERVWTNAIVYILVGSVVIGVVIVLLAWVWWGIMHGGEAKLRSLGLSPN